MISSPLVPAIIPQSLADLKLQLQRVGPVQELHIDVVDGKFVPYTSWPYINDSDMSQLETSLLPYTLEVDLMVVDPAAVAGSWIDNGADRLVFHMETISFTAFKQFADTTSITVGICASNDTPFEELEAYLEVADFVQVMGIAQIGVQGQPFDDRALERIAKLKELYPRVSVSLDGSVNATTLPDLLALRLDRYIMGSAVMSAEDPYAAYIEFSKIAHSNQQW